MPILSRSAQLAVAAVLALLMITTRGSHFASIEALPSASWAVFFLAGVFLRSPAYFVGLFALGSSIDFALLESGTVSSWCFSPAYWALLPAYGALWAAGRLYARLHRERLATLLPLGLCLVGGAVVAYLCSGGAFYFFSGRYPEPTLAGFLPRIAEYLPRYLGTLTLYVACAAVARTGLRAARGTAPVAAGT